MEIQLLTLNSTVQCKIVKIKVHLNNELFNKFTRKEEHLARMERMNELFVPTFNTTICSAYYIIQVNLRMRRNSIPPIDFPMVPM